MKLLFTGFEPFAAESANASWSWIADAAELAPERHDVSCVQLPASWSGCFEPLRAALRQPWDAVVCLGARDGATLAIERLALNENDPSWKDAEGRRPRSKTIVENGEAGYWTGLPYRELGIQLTAASIPSAPSHSAGGGLPNHVFYQLMRWIAESGSSVMGGLIQAPERGELAAPDEGTRRRFVACVLDTLSGASRQGDSLTFDLERLREQRADSFSRLIDERSSR